MILFAITDKADSKIIKSYSNKDKFINVSRDYIDDKKLKNLNLKWVYSTHLKAII